MLMETFINVVAEMIKFDLAASVSFHSVIESIDHNHNDDGNDYCGWWYR